MPRMEGRRILPGHLSSSTLHTSRALAVGSPAVAESPRIPGLSVCEYEDELREASGNLRQLAVACLLTALLYLLTFSWIASSLRHEFGFPLDDSWIHQTVGRNLALHGEPGINPQTRSSGTTSLLWSFVQAANYRWFGIDPVRYNLAISYVLLLFPGPLLLVLTHRDRLPIHLRWILAASPALMGNFLWLGMIGMEHLLFVVLSLAGLALWFQREPRGLLNAFSCGCISGLLAITRPEDACYGPFLVLLASGGLFGHRVLRDKLVLLGTWLLFVALMIAGEFWSSGSILPTTMKGRSWLYFHTTGGPHSLHTILRFLGSWVQRVPRQFGTEFTSQLHYVSGIVSPIALSGIAMIALMLLGFVYLMRRSGAATRAILLWAVAQFCIYLVLFPAAGHGGRYQPLNLMLMLPLLLTGFWLLLTAMHLSDALAIGFVAIAMVLAGALSLHAWRVVTLVGIRHINLTEGGAAQWIRQHLPPSTQIGAFDIGRVSYHGSARMIDLGGLSDPAYVPYLVQARVPEFLQAHHIRYVMLPGTGMEDLGFTPSLERHKLAEYCSNQAEWLLGFRYTIHAARCQEIYELPGE